MLSLFEWKIIAIVLLTVGVYLFGFAPLLFGNSIEKSYLSLLSAFSGGVLIGTTFVHLFPEVSELADQFRCSMGIKSPYPIGELLICIGLVAVMIIENLVEEYERIFHKHEVHVHEDFDEDKSLVDNHHDHDHGHHDHISHFAGNHGGWGSYILVIALSVHSVLEGIAIGLAETNEATLTLFLSVIIHEVCLAFALGLKLFIDNHTIKQFIISLSVFVVACPVGIGIGITVLSSVSDERLVETVFVMKALATGTFIQVTFLEILAPEFQHRHTNQLYKMGALTLGLMFISVLMYYLHTAQLQDFCAVVAGMGGGDSSVIMSHKAHD